MSFSPYQSIKNHTHTKSLKLIKSLALDHPDIEWVATEKVHGSNFCFICDGETVRCARRKDILDESESFYNWQSLREKYNQTVLDLYSDLSELLGSTGEIQMFGELYGGAYPHEDVENVNGVKAVQKGVYYRPDVDFYPFDISVEGHGFISYDVMKDLCTGKFLFADVLLRGTFDECFGYDVEFSSTIPTLLGLPLIENNIAEGIVMKPVHPVLSDDERVIIKKKHPKFEEVAYAPAPKKSSKKKVSSIPEEAQQFIDIAERYISENRVRNVISKIGEIEDSKSSRSNLMNLYNEDILADFIDDNPDFTALPENLSKPVIVFIKKTSAGVIGKNWQLITAGDF